MRPLRFLALGMLIALVAAACGGGKEETPPKAAAPASAEPTEKTPAEELKAIAAGLDQVVTLHEQGKKQEALDAAAVYLDRFERLEAVLILAALLGFLAAADQRRYRRPVVAGSARRWWPPSPSSRSSACCWTAPRCSGSC